MSYSFFPGNFSSRSCGGFLRQSGAFCGSSYPSNLVYSTDLCSPSTCQLGSTDLCSPSTCQLGSSLYTGCQETGCEPTSCQTSCVLSSSRQMSCYRPRTSLLCSPCQMTYPGSLGFGSRSCSSLGCGSSGFRPLGYGGCGFPSLGYGYGFCRPSYLASRSCQSSYYRPTCGSGFYQSTC
ncbi:keratin-associated protein 13-1-like [Nycticebus coucang]|uniref:keratin-associated protein 13-1-like n=1 Tax=Nycticebus coucang TaxID=9470 RepID=UPI00234C7B04|nr:keratin-associated protein 13-1-like [Nycticebus coucang]